MPCFIFTSTNQNLIMNQIVTLPALFLLANLSIAQTIPEQQTIQIPITMVNGYEQQSLGTFQVLADGTLKLVNIEPPLPVKKLRPSNQRAMPNQLKSSNCGGFTGIPCAPRGNIIYIEKPVEKIVYKDKVTYVNDCKKKTQ